MAIRVWLATCAGVALLANACTGSPGRSEVRGFDANTGQQLWAKGVDAESSQVLGVGCATRAEPGAACRDDVAVIQSFDNCNDVESVAVDPRSGRELPTPGGARTLLLGDQRLDPAWQAGTSACRQLGEAAPYFAGIAPLVDGVCLLHCVGPKTDQSASAGCTLAAVDATSGEELWRKEVGAFNHVTVRGSLLLVVRDRDDEEVSAAPGPYALSRVDVRSGTELWSMPSAERLSWAGVHGEQLLLASGQRLMSVATLDGSVSFDVPSSGAPAGVVGDVAFVTERLRSSECPNPD